MQKKMHDDDPKTGPTGAGAEEFRESGPINEIDLEARLQKQHPPIDLLRERPGAKNE